LPRRRRSSGGRRRRRTNPIRWRNCPRLTATLHRGWRTAP